MGIADKLSQALNDAIARWAFRAGRYVPFTAASVLWAALDRQDRSILDIGCGRGHKMTTIARSGFYSVGLDIHLPYLKECKRYYDECILSDARALPLKPKSFDIVLCTQVIEHLDKEAGRGLITEMEKIARRHVVISTPVGTYKNRPPSDRPYLEHRSAWLPDELKALDYHVTGSGFRGSIVIVKLLRLILPESTRALGLKLIFTLSAIANPVVYFLPKLAGGMVCVKKLH